MNERTKKIIALELQRARTLHPQFPVATATSIIMEELGELAQVFNDYKENRIDIAEFSRRATDEASHVAVTAIRLINRLTAKKS